MNWNPAKKAQMLLLEPNVECYEQKADSLGYQKMLRHQPIATRFSAVKRNTASKNVWG